MRLRVQSSSKPWEKSAFCRLPPRRTPGPAPSSACYRRSGTQGRAGDETGASRERSDSHRPHRVQSTTLSNALAESLFATVECELLQRVRLTNREEAKTEIFRFLEGFYNRRRRHSALGYVAPVEFERSWSEARVAAAKRGPAPAPAEFLEA